MSATEIAQAIRSGETTATEVVSEALRLAKTVGKDLNAFITICDESAIAQARAIDSKIARHEGPSGPLLGVPVAVKDNICYAACGLTCGSHILKGFIPPYDATAVKRLIEAGAVIVGKTNMDEFGMGSSGETSYYGPTRNPVAEGYVPGGSSSGSAAVVAAGIVPIALGSETGGSVRQPASFCGLFGLKPTYGAVSRYGLVAYGSSLDQIGSFARNVEDLALVLKVIGGRDHKDATSVDFDHPDYPALLDSDDKLKIGIPAEYFPEGLDQDVRAVTEEAIAALRRAGHQMKQVQLPLTGMTIPAYYIIAMAEASSNLARYDGVRYGLRASDESVAEMYRQTRSEGFGLEVKRRIMLGTFTLSAGYYDEYYRKAVEVRELITREFEAAFEEVELLIAPTTPAPAFGFGEKLEDPLAMYLADVYTAPANLAGIPGISIPFGTASDGRPVGVQLLAPHFKELTLLQLAAQMCKRE